MKKEIDIKERIVNMHDIDTGAYENEITAYLDKQMKVRFHSAEFNNSRYIFIGTPADQKSNSITVNKYRKRGPEDNFALVIE